MVVYCNKTAESIQGKNLLNTKSTEIHEEDDSVLVTTVVLAVAAVHADLLVILLQGSHVLPGLRELSLLHALPDIPVDEGSLTNILLSIVERESKGKYLPWHTSGRTCGPAWPRPRQWRWCWRACRRPSGPWRDLRQG